MLCGRTWLVFPGASGRSSQEDTGLALACEALCCDGEQTKFAGVTAFCGEDPLHDSWGDKEKVEPRGLREMHAQGSDTQAARGH